MNAIVLSGNPKSEGLCHAIIEAATDGLRAAGADVRAVPLCHGDIIACRVCGNGWGPCRAEHRCAFGDDGFHEVQGWLRDTDVLVIATPVYWGEPSEALKAFLDRLRRCEFGAHGALSGKQALLIASAGGSGNGTLSCLDMLDRFCRHVGADVFDALGVNRWNADYMRQAARDAAKAMGEGRRRGADASGSNGQG